MCSVVSSSLKPMDCSSLGSSLLGIFQARIAEWVAISFSRDLPDPGIKSLLPALAGRFFTVAPLGKPCVCLDLSEIQNPFLKLCPLSFNTTSGCHVIIEFIAKEY